MTHPASPERPIAWQPIESAPKDENYSFLVLLPGNSMCNCLVMQVSVFEGRMYPDAMDGNIDWGDGVEVATHWQPLPDAPALSESTGEPAKEVA